MLDENIAGYGEITKHNNIKGTDLLIENIFL